MSTLSELIFAVIFFITIVNLVKSNWLVEKTNYTVQINSKNCCLLANWTIASKPNDIVFSAHKFLFPKSLKIS